MSSHIRIHGASPAQCRYYRCVVMRIYDRGGDLAGKVTGTLALHSEDPVLRETWERTLAGIPEGTAGIEELLQRAFEARGYRVG